MAEAKIAKLMMCTELNNNKYYIMEWHGMSSNFNVKYGRQDSTEQTATYPISKWDTKYNEKVKKGYKDKTHTIVVKEVVSESTTVESTLAPVDDAKVERFLTWMKRYTDNLVKQTYKVKHQDVTQAQVDNAQSFIDKLMKIPENDVTLINATLLELYMEIPRYMSNVRDYLLPNINLKKVLEQEQF